MKKLSETNKELGIDFKFPIEIKDANGNKIYFEDNEGTIRAYLQTAMLDTELMKDKERLDWLIENASAYWVYTREDIDKAMNQPQ